MLTKMVNGLEVVMSDEEEAAIRAEWAANQAAPSAPAEPKLTDGALADLLVAKGILSAADVAAAKGGV